MIFPLLGSEFNFLWGRFVLGSYRQFLVAQRAVQRRKKDKTGLKQLVCVLSTAVTMATRTAFSIRKKVLFSTGCARLCDVQQLNPFSVVDLLKHISSPACQVRGAAEVNF